MSLRDKIRVLAVDDMSTSRAILLQGLDGLGILNIEHAENGKNGLLQVHRFKPDLVISDLYMPEMNGLQFLQHLRNDPVTRSLGFILLSGKTDKLVIETGRKLGMNNFLTKPYSDAQLKDVIESIVGRL